MWAGLALRPFEIHLHSFHREIKGARGLKSGHCAPRSFAEARASWAHIELLHLNSPVPRMLMMGQFGADPPAPLPTPAKSPLPSPEGPTPVHVYVGGGEYGGS